MARTYSIPDYLRDAVGTARQFLSSGAWRHNLPR